MYFHKEYEQQFLWKQLLSVYQGENQNDSTCLRLHPNSSKCLLNIFLRTKLINSYSSFLTKLFLSWQKKRNIKCFNSPGFHVFDYGSISHLLVRCSSNAVQQKQRTIGITPCLHILNHIYTSFPFYFWHNLLPCKEE